MGYLNNTSVVVDAILTNTGRQLLAQNDGSFQITQFSLSDDEVKDHLLFLLSSIASSEHLQALWNSTNALANKKVDEVSDLYVSFLSDTDTDNNN